MTDNEFDLLMTVATTLHNTLWHPEHSEDLAKLKDALSKFAPWPYVVNCVPALEGEEA